MSQRQRVVYQISTGTHSEILPEQYQVAGGVTYVYPGTDGKVYASVNSQRFRLDGFNITPIAASAAAPAGMIVGATSVKGGGGSVPTASGATLFLFDPATRTKIFDTKPISTGTIGNLVSSGNLVYGVAGSVFFVWDPVGRAATYHARLVDSGTRTIFTPLASSMAVGADGNLWGLADLGIFKIDLKTYAGTVMATPPKSISSGFAMDASNIYFASGSSLYSYLWSPLLVAEAATGRPFLAPDAIGSLYGDNLPAGVTSVTINDSSGADHAATVIYSGAGQTDFVVPSDVSPGLGRITAAGITSPIEIRPVAPGIFAATQEQAGYVTLYATGVRHCSDISKVVAQFNAANGQVQYAGDQRQYAGLDQINLAVPAGLTGTVTIRLWVDGVAANPVTVTLP